LGKSIGTVTFSDPSLILTKILIEFWWVRPRGLTPSQRSRFRMGLKNQAPNTPIKDMTDQFIFILKANLTFSVLKAVTRKLHRRFNLKKLVKYFFILSLNDTTEKESIFKLFYV
jgi:hypothetical protein